MEPYAKYKNSGIERTGKMPKSRDYISERLSVQKKDSGVDWIGDIPEHWEVTKTKWMFEIVKRLYDKVCLIFRLFLRYGVRIVINTNFQPCVNRSVELTAV